METIHCDSISFNFAENSALYDLIGAENVEEIKTNGPVGLKNCFSLLMHSNDVDVNSCIAKLMESFHTNGKAFCLLFHFLSTIN